MTHPRNQIARALQLGSEGWTASAIAYRLGIPRSTVRDWLSGQLPLVWLEGEAGCEGCGAPPHAYDELPAIYAYLLGLYLGDGSIATHRREVFKLRVNLDGRYPGIIDETARAMRLVMPVSKVQRWARTSRDVEVYSYSKSWPCLFPQHGPGKKHQRSIVLSDWQERSGRRSPHLLLRGLIHSDGCRFMNTGRNWRHPRYAFSNLSNDIRRIFADACDLMGVNYTTSGRVVYVSRKGDVAFMDRFIGPKA